MSSAVLRLQYRVLAHKVSSVRAFKLNWKAIYFFAMVLSLLLLALYIFRINQLTQGAYVIKAYNKQMSTATQENKTLETHFAESGFLGQAMEKARDLSFEKTTNVKYLQITGGSLAEAR